MAALADRAQFPEVAAVAAVTTVVAVVAPMSIVAAPMPVAVEVVHPGLIQPKPVQSQTQPAIARVLGW